MLILAAHQFELEAGKLVKADHAEDDEPGSNMQGELDHGQLAIIS